MLPPRLQAVQDQMSKESLEAGVMPFILLGYLAGLTSAIDKVEMTFQMEKLIGKPNPEFSRAIHLISKGLQLEAQNLTEVTDETVKKITEV